MPVAVGGMAFTLGPESSRQHVSRRRRHLLPFISGKGRTVLVLKPIALAADVINTQSPAVRLEPGIAHATASMPDCDMIDLGLKESKF